VSKTVDLSDQLAPKEKHYRARIKRFIRAMEPNSIAIIASLPERTRSNDTEHPYRQSSDILYFNGFDEPESALVFSNVGDRRGKLIMFVREKDAKREQWTGIRAGVEGAKKYFADEAHTIDKFEEVLRELIASADNVYYKFGHNEHFDRRVNSVWSKMASPRTLHNPEDITHGLRMIKSAEEIKLMAEAGRISAEAHKAAARRCRPGLKEYQLQATMEFVFKDNGAMSPAYTSIVANGGSGWVLHYISNQGELKKGEMVLIDAACELRGYAADITRTFPVSGKFNEAQRQIYQLVLDAQLAAIDVAKPGANLAQVHMAAADVLRRGLVKLGLLSAQMRTSKGEQQAVKAIKDGKLKKLATLSTFFPHGTSHWLGLDVHDVGTNGTRSDRAKDRPLEPGMVFTVEPGLYFDAKDKSVPAKYRGIAVRIEDDVLITKGGNRVLTSGVPKEIVEVEKLMAR
jgi:Xaa-Pro aminopeptidase